MKYTDEDLERARSLARTHLSVAELQDYEIEAIAAAFADARAEAIAERDGALVKVGEVWLERNRAVAKRDALLQDLELAHRAPPWNWRTHIGWVLEKHGGKP